MSVLVLGLVIFFGVHMVPAWPPLRDALAARLGDKGYFGAFALFGAAAFVRS